MKEISNLVFRIEDLVKHLRIGGLKSQIRNPKSEIVFALFFIVLFQAAAAAKCPLPDGGTLIVRAPVGNLQVDTTGRDGAEAQVNNNSIQLREICGPQSAEITSNTPLSAQIQGTVIWKITVPRSVNLDLVAYAGAITVGDSDGNVTMRTTGGPVIAGNIKGRAAIISQGGFIKAGNIGGSAELRSEGGSLDVGNVAGDAELETAGPINAGIITGRVNANTAGGSITIREAHGEVRANTQAGDISVGDALRINAKTAGGNITSRRVRGSFQGHTESGDIRVESAAAWIEASTGFGNIVVTMIPDNLDGDLHVDLQVGVGDVTIHLPAGMKASVLATVERPAFNAQRISSDFPLNSVSAKRSQSIAPSRFLAPLQSEVQLNGGGNPVKLHTSLGKIEIKKR